MEPHKDLFSIFILAQPVGSRIIRQTNTIEWEPFLVRNLFIDVLDRTGQMSASPGIDKLSFTLFTGGRVDLLDLLNARMR